jgi:tetratricopeptide (TPR) repeat protein
MPFFIKSAFIFISGFFFRIAFFSLFPVIAIYCDSAGAQNLIRITADDQLAYADHCFRNQEFEIAAAEYQRFIYFFPDDPRTETAEYKIGMAYFQNKSYVKALGRFTRIFDNKGPVDIGISSALMISRCYQRIQNYPAAIDNLFYLRRIIDDTGIHDEVFYRIGWLYLESGELDRANMAFSKISPENRTVFRGP